jgi:acyl-CoA thioesterase-1
MNHDFMAALTGAESLLPDYRRASHPWCSCFLWLVLLLTSLHYVSFPALASNTASATAVVMVYGDSLSAAYGIKPEQGWVSLMEKRLASDGIRVINASISGETTAGGLARIQTDLNRHKPGTVVLALGANDGLRGLPVAIMRRNLEGMIDAIERTGGRVILVGIRIPPNYGIEYTSDFQNVFAALAARRRLALVPFLLDGIAEDLDNFQADRLHPVAAAQARILQNVLPVVQRTVGRPPRPAPAAAVAKQ